LKNVPLFPNCLKISRYATNFWEIYLLPQTSAKNPSLCFKKLVEKLGQMLVLSLLAPGGPGGAKTV